MITPINGGQIKVSPVPLPTTNGLYSPQYIKAKRLELRPTEWVPGGRPIYKRLPLAGQTYQVSFENDGEIGYVYISSGSKSVGAGSLEVVSSDTFEDIVIFGGTIVWDKGRSTVKPAILNIKEIDIKSGKYFLGYELVYDTSESAYQYSATDYFLYGETLDIKSSTDSVVGWRYSSTNAFTPESELFWKNSDNFFPSYAQPAESYIEWKNNLAAAYETIKVRIPKNMVIPEGVVAVLSYPSLSDKVTTSTIKYESDQGYFDLNVDNPTFQTNWKISWVNDDGSAYLPIAVESIEITGVITLSSKPSGPTPKASLVMYAENTVPQDNVLCQLAWVDINSRYEVEDITDARSITNRDYVPVADWLTRPWDDNLTRLYEQVREYPEFWMSPTTCMKFEYEDLTVSGITVS
mgnify:CR=1 FL=1